MNLLNLKYFVDIASCGSVSAAARANIVAQQSMSDHLKKLEQYYGTSLFHRTKPLTLTPAGEILLRCAKSVLGTAERAKQDIDALAAAQKSFLGIGLIYNDTPPFLHPLLDRMQQQGRGETRVYDACVRGGTVHDDVELVLAPFPPAPDWEGVQLLQDRFGVVVRADLMDAVYGDRRAAVEQAMRETGDLRLLSELPFMQFTPDLTPDGPPALSDTPDQLELPNVVLRTGNGNLQNSVCRSGQCAIVVVMDYARRAFADRDDLLVFPLSGEQNRCGCSIYFRAGKPLSPQADLFLRLAQEHFRETV